MIRIFLILSICLLLFAGCSSPSSDLEDRGVLDVIQDAGEDEYTPPDDGLLTEEQVKMYLQVRERALEMAATVAEEAKASSAEAKEADESGSGLGSLMKGMEALGDLGNLVTVDIRAAQQLGVNSSEYQWVKGQVMLAQLQTSADEMLKGLQESLGDQVQQEEDDDARINRANGELIKPYLEQISDLDEKMREAMK